MICSAKEHEGSIEARLEAQPGICVVYLVVDNEIKQYWIREGLSVLGAYQWFRTIVQDLLRKAREREEVNG